MTSWLRFPVALRKMWSGGEVQAWLDEHAPAMTATPVPLPDLSDWHSPDRKSITALLHAHAAARTDTLSKRVEELEVLLTRSLAAMDEWHIAFTLREEIRATLPSQPKEPTPCA